MSIGLNLLLFAHLMGLAMGFGGGIGMSQVVPRLVAAHSADREPFWAAATMLSRIAGAGLLVLLLTGPAMLWIKFGGTGGQSGWFWAKMAFVAVGILAYGVSEAAKARFKRGDESAAKMFMISGPLTGIAMTFVVLCAVLTFN